MMLDVALLTTSLLKTISGHSSSSFLFGGGGNGWGRVGFLENV